MWSLMYLSCLKKQTNCVSGYCLNHLLRYHKTWLEGFVTANHVEKYIYIQIHNIGIFNFIFSKGFKHYPLLFEYWLPSHILI
jgi:hypothetical protein